MYITFDLWDDVFDILPIRDKRMWMRSCKMMLAYFVDKLEVAKKTFREAIDKSEFLGQRKFAHLDKIQQLTIESLYSGYVLSENHLVEENYVLHRCPMLYYNLAERGEIDLLKQMMEFIHTNDLSFMIYQIWNNIGCGAMYGGHVAIYDWIDENADVNAIDYQSLTAHAVRGGHLDMLKLMYYRIDGFNVEMHIGNNIINLFDIAAKHGHLHIIEFLISVGFFCNYGMCFSRAAMGPDPDIIQGTLPGRIKVIEWAAKNDIYKTIPCDYLAGMEDLKLFNWALDQGYKCAEYVCYFAAYNNRFDNLKQCYTNGHKLKGDFFIGAIRAGNIEMLEWLLCRIPNFQLTKEMCIEAASTKHLEIIKWLRKLGCPWDNKMLEFCYDDIDMLQYVIENGLEVSDDVCHLAIDYEDINILKLLRQHHTWTKEFDDHITDSKHKGMIEWTKSY